MLRSRQSLKLSLTLAAFAALLVPLSSQAVYAQTKSPAKSRASSSKAPAEDLPNFHQVGPGIYRGGAPTVAGLDKLRAMGVRRIIDLRIAPRTVAREKAEVQKRGMDWINLPMSGDPPTEKQVAQLRAALHQAPGTPVFVHCQHGADRTGCMIGIWRVADQGWTFDKTWAEMRKYGFNPHWKKLTNSVQKRVSHSQPNRPAVQTAPK